MIEYPVSLVDPTGVVHRGRTNGQVTRVAMCEDVTGEILYLSEYFTVVDEAVTCVTCLGSLAPKIAVW